MPVKKMLVPTDFSVGSNHALKYAVGIAQSMKTAVHLVHVVESVVYFSDSVRMKHGYDELSNELETHARKNLERLGRKLTRSKVRHTETVLHGKAAEEILAYANRCRCDMICIANHGRGNIENMIFGSTTEKVLRKASCPVLVVRIHE